MTVIFMNSGGEKERNEGNALWEGLTEAFVSGDER
jgi:hypothetical protein